ncbi:MAG: DUF4390 domain-containing protein [Methylophaga nitratireducenticrescens]|nr:MAG: DUF4390 domain-containing protein [Methylophaga nitratireducenticrescens]THK41622.1 DUF4390 domain-containing protein [Methylophaga sp. SB9B]
MVSIMPAYVTVKRLLTSIVFVFVSVQTVQAESFYIADAHTSPAGNGYLLNAEINYPLNARVKEALYNGVPITFVQEIQLIRVYPVLGEWWQWRNNIWSTEIRYVLRYHDLSQQYLLHSMATKTHRNFPTMEGALNAMGEIKDLSLPPQHTLETDNLILRLRSQLDLNALPSPMRPGAFLSSKWDLASDWYEVAWPSN